MRISLLLCILLVFGVYNTVAQACSPPPNYQPPTIKQKFEQADYVVEVEIDNEYPSISKYNELHGKSTLLARQLRKAGNEVDMRKLKSELRELEKQMYAIRVTFYSSPLRFLVRHWFKGGGPAQLLISGFGPGGSCRSDVPKGRAILFLNGDIGDDELHLQHLGIYDGVYPVDSKTVKSLSELQGCAGN